MPNPAGYYFKLDPSSGRFIPSAAETVNSPGDGTVVVTGSPDINAAGQALNAGGAIPLAASAKWSVSYTSLQAAIAGGTKAVFTPYTPSA